MTSPHPVATGHEALIGSLDLPAKVALLTGASMFTLRPEPSIGLGEMRMSDGPTGVRGLTFTGGRTVALFPNATLLAAAWNPASAYEVGRMLAEEAVAQGIHVVLGPTINLHRSPLGGRLFEAYSEDPLLSGVLAAAYVRGLQDHGVGACLKHLVANESETARHTVDSVVDEATLRELYLLPFEIAVADADAWSIMAAYNKVNGTPATEQHHVINEIVKGEWGYRGLIVSDWWATTSAAPAANGGLDLVMPGPGGPWGRHLVDAVTAGDVDKAVIDDHVRRLLLLAERAGVLGEPRERQAPVPAPDSPMRREQLTRLAAEGMTVLKNERATLPLARGATVALIGRHALETIDMGGGSAQVNPPYQVSVAEGLTALLGDAVAVTDGVEARHRPVPAAAGFAVHPVTGEPGVQVSVHAEDGSVIDERHAASGVAMIGIDDDLPEPPHAVRLRARLPQGGKLQVGGIGAGAWEVRVGQLVERFELTLDSGDVGEAVLRPPGGTTLADAEPGDLLETEVTLAETAGRGRRGLYGLVARPAPENVDAVVARAVSAAQDADVAVVVVGLTEEQETESVDKTTLRLPGAQDALVAAVAAAARRTVVVVNAATPILMPWLDQVDAVLWAGLPGQEGGHAVAATLLGDIEPAGRLVTTFPAADEAGPAWSVTPVEGRLEYTEGAFVGYRGHDRGPAPAFWFGHGLGYSTWEYSDAAILDGQGHRLAVTVTNTGGRTSREVVQVYFRPTDDRRPVRLVGWQAATVEPGESARVEVATDPRLWRYWDETRAAWTPLPSQGRIIFARGLGDVRATLELSGR
ncbi:glycoside hydrolase family 3 C-terminal domain-containing protein [Nonomuraea maheshkhaliensis]|uniref:Glycoside hydrolase family 3 C-terminal domain-containing protein n=1 Tax=Nonomuraea maheshkhaliensis TaxID=419590 RepID=A0ABP4RHA5_9ACTN